MEEMTIKDDSINTHVLERKRKFEGEADEEQSIRARAKRVRSADEILCDMLAELDDSVDWKWGTHCRDWKLKDVGKKEEEDDLFLRMLRD